MGGDKGGSADSSGMAMAMASAEAADKAYALGEQQFQWSKQVWEQEQPLVDASEQAQIDLAHQQTSSLTQMQDEAKQQWDEYVATYKPMEEGFAQEATNWDSPQAIADARGKAMADVGEQGMAGVNTAAQTLKAYGVNPGSGKFASLYTDTQPMIGAAEAAAGTTAAQNLRLQKMGLEAGAINTGRGMVNTTGSLTQAGTGAGTAASSSASGAANTAFGNLSGTAVGAGATSNLFNAGTGAMNAYVGAVNGYNDSNAAFAQANATEMAGIGSAIGGIAGIGLGHFMHGAKGGPVTRFEDGGSVGGGSNDVPPMPSSDVHGPEWEAQFKAHNDAFDRKWGLPPTPDYPPKSTNRLSPEQPPDTPPKLHRSTVRPTGPRAMYTAMGGPMYLEDGGDTDPTMTPDQGGGATGIPSQPMPPAGSDMPSDATPGGGVPAYASPSNGQVTDDVPAMLTANEFVIPKDVATWKGHEYFAKQIDAARRAQQQFASRDDIGGEPAPGIPQQPTFVSRPNSNMGTTAGAIPGMA